MRIVILAAMVAVGFLGCDGVEPCAEDECVELEEAPGDPPTDEPWYPDAGVDAGADAQTE
jgi:hypothetical protein